MLWQSGEQPKSPMKSRLALVLVSLVILGSVFVAGQSNPSQETFAIEEIAPPALTIEGRAALVTRLREMSQGAAWWSEYYSYGPVDAAFNMGRAEAYATAAQMLEDAGEPASLVRHRD